MSADARKEADTTTLPMGNEASSSPVGPGAATSRIVVPRHLRRGLLARFGLIPEIEVARNKTRREKWIITAVVALCGGVGPFGSAITLPVLGPIADFYHTSSTLATFSLSIYMLGLAIFPLWWSSASEQFGRRSIYIVSNGSLALFGILSAISPSIPVFLVMRFFTGGAASAALSVGAGTIADIWEPKERGRAMGYYLLGPLCGPLVAPLIGGALGEGLGWRSTMWFMSIYGFVMAVLVVVTLPETSSVKISTAQPDSKPTTSSGSLVAAGLRATNTVIIQPFALLRYLRFPAVALTVYLHSVSFGSLYFMSISLQYTFGAPPYEFRTWLIGFVFAPPSVGFVVAGMAGGPWMDSIMRKHATKKNRVDSNGKLVYLPEDRMRENAWLGLLLYPGMMVWYGWAAHFRLHWALVLSPTLLIGFSSFLLISMSTTMLTEFMPGRAASGVAISNLCRNIIAFAASLATTPWLNAIGNGWVMTAASVWILTLAVVILLTYRYGSEWRESMNRELKIHA